MKRKITTTLVAVFVFAFTNLFAQVPNAGFENWTAGNPDLWTTDNISGFSMPVTAATPAHSGAFALKGDVVSSAAGPMAALVSSMDMSGNGFPVSQSYATFSFYYKTNLSASAVLSATLVMYDAGHNVVGTSGQLFTGMVTSYTLANLPVYYFGTSPVECVIIFTVADTVLSNPPIGNYFIVDDVSLSGVSSVHDLVYDNATARVRPNPSNTHAIVTLENSTYGQARLFLFDTNGRLVKQDSQITTQAKTFDWDLSVADLPSGIYSAYIVCGRNQWQSKIVKE